MPETALKNDNTRQQQLTNLHTITISLNPKLAAISH